MYQSIFSNQAKAKALATESRLSSTAYQAELLAFHARHKHLPRNERYKLSDYPKRSIASNTTLASVMNTLKQDLTRIGFTLEQTRSFLSL